MSATQAAPSYEDYQVHPSSTRLHIVWHVPSLTSNATWRCWADLEPHDHTVVKTGCNCRAAQAGKVCCHQSSAQSRLWYEWWLAQWNELGTTFGLDYLAEHDLRYRMGGDWSNEETRQAYGALGDAINTLLGERRKKYDQTGELTTITS